MERNAHVRRGASVGHPKMKTYERVYLEIKRSILKQDMSPGDALPISEVARRFNASPTPVREALSRLEQEGLVVSRNGKKIVRVLSVGELNQIFDIKKAVESHIAGLAVQRHRPAQLAELQAIVDDMERFLDENRDDLARNPDAVSQWLELDRRFHQLIYLMAENDKASEFVGQLNLQWHQYRMGLMKLSGMLRKSIQEHIQIGCAILKGNEGEAISLVVDHLEEVRATLNNVLEAFQFTR